MGLMLSSLLLVPVGCGEEAPPAPATPDPAAMMGHAADMGAHSADSAPGAVDAAADKAGDVVDPPADTAGDAVDSAKEPAKDAAP